MHVAHTQGLHEKRHEHSHLIFHRVSTHQDGPKLVGQIVLDEIVTTLRARAIRTSFRSRRGFQTSPNGVCNFLPLVAVKRVGSFPKVLVCLSSGAHLDVFRLTKYVKEVAQVRLARILKTHDAHRNLALNVARVGRNELQRTDEHR